MQPGVPAEAGSAKAVTQRQASQRQAAERPLPFPGSGTDAFVRCRRGPKVRKASANAPSLPAGSEGPKGERQCSVVAGGVRRTERRAPMLRPLPTKPVGPRTGRGLPHPGGSLRESALAGAPFAGSTHARALRKRPSPGATLQERPPPGAPVREGSRGSARAGGFSRERPCGRVPAKAPRKVPRKAPRVCPGSYCFGFGCAGRWLSSSSAASSAR